MIFKKINIDELKPGDLFIWYFEEEDATADQMIMVATIASMKNRAEQRSKLPSPDVWLLVENLSQPQPAERKNEDVPM